METLTTLVNVILIGSVTLFCVSIAIILWKVIRNEY